MPADPYRAGLMRAAEIANRHAMMTAEELRLQGGEMTAQECRTAKAFMWLVARSIKREAGEGK